MPKIIMVGVGGTGYEILRCLRRQIVKRNPEQGLDAYRNVGFLYVDPVAPVDTGTPRWQVDGKSLALKAAEIVTIQPSGLGKIISDLGARPDLREWLPTEQMRGLDVSAAAVKGCQQIRPFGRLLFTENAETVKRSFLQTLQRLDQGVPGPTQVYLACSVMGGTGGGMFLDLAYSIRKWTNEQAQLTGMLVLPDLNDPRGDRALPNAYAALKELNYFSLRRKPAPGGEKPVGFRLSGDAKPMEGNPFFNTYLFEPRNQAEPMAVELSFDALLEMIGLGIYLRISLDPKTNLQDPLADHIEQIVNNADQFRAEYLRDPFNRNLLAQTFSSFGLSTIVYPADEIADIVACRLRGRLFQRWRQERSAGDATIRIATARTGLMLDDEHLLGDKSFFGGVDYPGVEVEVAAAVENEIQTPTKTSKSVFLHGSHAAYPGGFRNVGSLRFYGDLLNEVQRATDLVLEKVRAWVASSLVKAEEGWGYARADLAELLRQIRAKRIEYQQKKDSGQNATRNSGKELTVALGALTEAEGSIINHDRKAREALRAVRALMITNRVAIIRDPSYGLAMALLDSIIPKVEALLRETDAIGDRLIQEANEAAQRETEYSKNLATQKADRRSFNGTMLYDPDRVNQIFATIDVDQAINAMQTDVLTDKDVFELLNPTPQPGAATPPPTADQLVQDAALAWLNARQTLLTKNVADQLLEFYPDANRRVGEIRSNLNRCKPFIEFSRHEMGLFRGQGDYAYSAAAQKFATAVGILGEEENRRTSISVVADDLRDGGAPKVIECNDRNRIVFLSETAAFPLRMIRSAADLKRHYNDYLHSGSGVAVHIQRSFDPPISDIFTADAEERTSTGEEAFMVSWLEGKIALGFNTEQKRDEIHHKCVDQGRTLLRFLGTDWDSALRKWISGDADTADSLQRAVAEVSDLLAGLRTRDERLAFVARLYGLIDAIRKLYGEHDKRYIHWDQVRTRFMAGQGCMLLQGDDKNTPVVPVPFKIDLPRPSIEDVIVAPPTSQADATFGNYVKVFHTQAKGKLTPGIETLMRKRGTQLGLADARITELIGQVFSVESPGLAQYRETLRTFLELGPLTDEAQGALVELIVEHNLAEADVERVQAEEQARGAK